MLTDITIDLPLLEKQLDTLSEAIDLFNEDNADYKLDEDLFNEDNADYKLDADLDCVQALLGTIAFQLSLYNEITIKRIF